MGRGQRVATNEQKSSQIQGKNVGQGWNRHEKLPKTQQVEMSLWMKTTAQWNEPTNFFFIIISPTGNILPRLFYNPTSEAL